MNFFLNIPWTYVLRNSIGFWLTPLTGFILSNIPTKNDQHTNTYQQKVYKRISSAERRCGIVMHHKSNQPHNESILQRNKTVQ